VNWNLAQNVTFEVDDGGLGATFWIVWIAIWVFYIVVFWRIFTKAGQPGWASLIPIYNIYILTKIVGREWWWLLLLLIPLVNIVVLFILYIDLAKSFGKSTAFGVGLVLLGIIFAPILAFGEARYIGPAAAPGRALGAPPPPPPPPPPAV
jgi:hypothetical protein